MKILIAGLQSRYEQYLPDLPITKQVEMVFCKRSLSDEVFAAAAPEAEIIVDAACTASFDPKLHEEALDLMEALQITVMNR